MWTSTHAVSPTPRQRCHPSLSLSSAPSMSSQKGGFVRHRHNAEEECLLPSRRSRLRHSSCHSRVAPRPRARASSREASFPPLGAPYGESFFEGRGDKSSAMPPIWTTFSSPPSQVQASAGGLLSQKENVETAILEVISQAAGKAVQQALADHYSASKKRLQGDEDEEPVTEAMVRIMPGNIGLRAETEGEDGEAENRLLSLPPLTCRFAIDKDVKDPEGRPKIRHVSTEVASEADECNPACQRESSASTMCTKTSAPSFENLSSFSSPAQTARQGHPTPGIYGPAYLVPSLYPQFAACLSPRSSAFPAGLSNFSGFSSERFRSFSGAADLLERHCVTARQRRESLRGPRSSAPADDETGIDTILAQGSLSTTRGKDGEAVQGESGSRRNSVDPSTAERLELRKLLKGVVKLWSTTKQYENMVNRLKEWARDRYLATGELPDRTQLATDRPGLRSQCCQLKASVKQQAANLREQMKSLLPADANIFAAPQKNEDVAPKKPAASYPRQPKTGDKGGSASLLIGEKLERIEHLLTTVERVLPPQAWKDADDSSRSKWLDEKVQVEDSAAIRRLVGTFRQIKAVQSQVSTLLQKQGKCLSPNELLHGNGRSSAGSASGRKEPNATEACEDKKTEHSEGGQETSIEKEQGAERQASEEGQEAQGTAGSSSAGHTTAAVATIPLLKKKLREVTAEHDALENRFASVLRLHEKQQRLLVDLAKENEKHLTELLTVRGTHRIFGCVYTPGRDPSGANSWELWGEEDDEESSESGGRGDPAARFAAFEQVEAQAAEELEVRGLGPVDGSGRVSSPDKETEMHLSLVKAFLARRTNSLSTLFFGGSKALPEPGSRRKGKNSAFEFDRVYPADTRVRHLFHGFSDLLQSCVGDGLNFCLVAVGPRTPEKTALLLGRPPSFSSAVGPCCEAKDVGLAQLLSRFVFDELEKVCLKWASEREEETRSRTGRSSIVMSPAPSLKTNEGRRRQREAKSDGHCLPQFSVSVSCLEISRERMKDNFVGDKRLAKKLDIRRDTRTGEVKILNLTTRATPTCNSLLQAISEASSSMPSSVLGGDAEIHSSSLLFIHTEVVNPATREVKRGKIALVDMPSSFSLSLPPELKPAFDAAGRRDEATALRRLISSLSSPSPSTALSLSGREVDGEVDLSLNMTFGAIKEIFLAARRTPSTLCPTCRPYASSTESEGARERSKSTASERADSVKGLYHSTCVTQVLEDCLNPSLSRALLLFCLPSHGSSTTDEE
ncbi:kinesin motor domain-containing protein [Toxoplasma gondii GAB2-2007-GAL-DOM2]|uniref:Kinesin motor domain-containing protein n=2 Tax=Toxoplasma gondii TaxID=5811 RepID=A0A086LA68_TOXGO|nr:kinesin motor domain-containing protein [Toxoplasma gondii GAB2-2007-GAL-DOM2]KFG53536.1 kinesin motor domain-containing protein [Toxoplasma gondii FOU]